jgi:hypothetical protein
MTIDVLLKTEFKDFQLVSTWKVRDVYDLGDKL